MTKETEIITKLEKARERISKKYDVRNSLGKRLKLIEQKLDSESSYIQSLKEQLLDERMTTDGLVACYFALKSRIHAGIRFPQKELPYTYIRDYTPPRSQLKELGIVPAESTEFLFMMRPQEISTDIFNNNLDSEAFMYSGIDREFSNSFSNSYDTEFGKLIRVCWDHTPTDTALEKFAVEFNDHGMVVDKPALALIKEYRGRYYTVRDRIPFDRQIRIIKAASYIPQYREGKDFMEGFLWESGEEGRYLNSHISNYFKIK